MYLQQITEKIIEAITKTIRKESNDKHRFFMQIPFISGLFGEADACMEKTPLMVSALAVEETQVLMLNAHRVLQTCTSACDFHRRLVENLVAILAKKNLTLTRKID